MEKHKPNNLKRYGLIGKNIDYSFSRGYFAEKFDRESISNCRYENFDLPTIASLKPLLKDVSIMGMNVTIPYKEAVIPYLDDLKGDAKTIGAVNTIVFDNQRKAIGYNTDAYGFEKALLDVLPSIPEKALILGTGGAAKAIAFVLEKNNIQARFVSRNPKENQWSYDQLDPEKIESHQLIVNCSPLGTHPNIEQKPDIPYAHVGPQHTLFDLIYNPQKTRFLALGEQQGARIQNGAAMLVNQAEEAWRLWNQGQ